MIRQQPHYRRHAFEQGLRAVGYNVLDNGHPSSRRDVLVIWNRYGAYEAMADSWEAKGGTVLVCENGYCGKDAQDRQLYAISAHGHNGSGTFKIGGPERWDALGIALEPWRDGGEYALVCGQRGIGSRMMASPADWHTGAAAQLKAAGYQVKVRLHPGNNAPAVPLEDDLAKASVCAIWSSGSGVKALQMGVPVLYSAPHWICDGAAVRLRTFAPVKDDGARLTAMREMAWGQWTVEEIERGQPFANFLESWS